MKYVKVLAILFKAGGYRVNVVIPHVHHEANEKQGIGTMNEVIQNQDPIWG